MEDCCSNPKYTKAYIWFPPFKGVYCERCGSAFLVCNIFLAIIWNLFLFPFWKHTAWIVGEGEYTEVKVIE